MPRYMILDDEVENHQTYKRFANPFDPVNYIVARGWKLQGDTECSWQYFHSREEALANPVHIPDDVTLLVGHNIKFDLHHEWYSPSLHAFFKRGGEIWDTQYAEYLLQGMQESSHMLAMDDIIEQYGGKLKMDAVKALWKAGYLTSQIDRDLLIDYLVGSEEEKRNGGDIGNTELIFLGQIKKVVERGMLPMVKARMDGLCATTEMEYNGLKIDVQEAGRRMKVIQAELDEVNAALAEYIPDLPEEVEFNWSSKVHVSALIFGGAIKYKKQLPYIDPKTGDYARKTEMQDWPLFNGEPVDPAGLTPDVNAYPAIIYPGQDVFTSGKKKGQPRFKKVKVTGELKTRYQDCVVHLPGHTEPSEKWKTAATDGEGNPLYSTSADVIDELGKRDIPFLKLMARRQDLSKDLGTYYVQYDGKEYKGMLTCVMQGTHIIHHNLNHTKTVTSRLSSDNPNLQNIPKADTSEVKKMFISRFGEDGQMVEADYSQLEVVVQGMLSGDKNLIRDLNNRVDFHCKRVSAWKGVSYEEAVARCKDENHPEYKVWKGYRNHAKVFSFQRAYGAGAAKIAETTGMPIEDVQALIEAEEELYPGILEFNAMVEEAVKATAQPFKDPVRGFRVFRRGSWQCPTGTVYSWRSYDAPEWMRKKGVTDTFKPTELKNYPIQGTGGEIVQIICGKLWRHFLSVDNYGGRAFLCNTVHDSVWIDSHKDVLMAVAEDTKRIMESVPETLHALYGMEVPVRFPVEVEAGDNMYSKHLLHI